MQSGITVSGSAISGVLNYVTGYTGFNGTKVEEQSGNYLAMRVDPDDASAVIKAELVGGTSGKGLITLDSDRQFVFRITNKATQKVKIVVQAGGQRTEKIYSLNGLTLKTA